MKGAPAASAGARPRPALGEAPKAPASGAAAGLGLPRGWGPWITGRRGAVHRERNQCFVFSYSSACAREMKGAVGNIPTPREGSSPMPPTHSPPRWHSLPRYRCPPPQPQLQRALRARGRRAWGSPTATAQTAAPARATNSRGAGSQTGTKTRNPRPRARCCSSGWHRKPVRAEPPPLAAAAAAAAAVAAAAPCHPLAAATLAAAAARHPVEVAVEVTVDASLAGRGGVLRLASGVSMGAARGYAAAEAVAAEADRSQRRPPRGWGRRGARAVAGLGHVDYGSAGCSA